MSSEKFIIIKTRDDEEFKVEEAITVRSQVIKHLIEDTDHASKVITLSNVDGKTMAKVVEYWKKHSEEDVSEDQLKDFGRDFLNEDRSTIHELLLAASYLSDKELLNVMIQAVADRIKDKILDIENDFTAEEEREIHRENEWVYT